MFQGKKLSHVRLVERIHAEEIKMCFNFHMEKITQCITSSCDHGFFLPLGNAWFILI